MFAIWLGKQIYPPECELDIPGIAFTDYAFLIRKWPIHFRIDGGGIFDLNVDLAVITIGALKDRLLTLGHIASRDVRLCRIDHGREVEITMRSATLVKDYFGGEYYPNLNPNLIHIVIKNPPPPPTKATDNIKIT